MLSTEEAAYRMGKMFASFEMDRGLISKNIQRTEKSKQHENNPIKNGLWGLFAKPSLMI